MSAIFFRHAPQLAALSGSGKFNNTKNLGAAVSQFPQPKLNDKDRAELLAWRTQCEEAVAEFDDEEVDENRGVIETMFMSCIETPSAKMKFMRKMAKQKHTAAYVQDAHIKNAMRSYEADTLLAKGETSEAEKKMRKQLATARKAKNFDECFDVYKHLLEEVVSESTPRAKLWQEYLVCACLCVVCRCCVCVFVCIDMVIVLQDLLREAKVPDSSPSARGRLCQAARDIVEAASVSYLKPVCSMCC